MPCQRQRKRRPAGETAWLRNIDLHSSIEGLGFRVRGSHGISRTAVRKQEGASAAFATCARPHKTAQHRPVRNALPKRKQAETRVRTASCSTISPFPPLYTPSTTPTSTMCSPPNCITVCRSSQCVSVLFIGTRFSNLYTATPVLSCSQYSWHLLNTVRNYKTTLQSSCKRARSHTIVTASVAVCWLCLRCDIYDGNL